MLCLPSVKFFACTLKLCRDGRNLLHSMHLFRSLQICGMENHKLLENYLVLTLVDSGLVADARKVLDDLLHPNEHSWNFLITGYVKHEEYEHALMLYYEMQKQPWLCLSPHAFMALLKACRHSSNLQSGVEIHVEIVRCGLFERDDHIAAAIIDKYAKLGSISKAQEVFVMLRSKCMISYTALIDGYVEHGYGEEAILCFEQMQNEGISPDDVTFICVLKACGDIVARENGHDVHAQIVMRGLENEILVRNTLVDMYAKCNLMIDAQHVFNKLINRTVVSWTALIAGYTEMECGHEAFNRFQQMQLDGVLPDNVTFSSVCKACAYIGNLSHGQEVHSQIIMYGLEIDDVIKINLIHMYTKCGLFLDAREISNNISTRNTLSWTALISGYSEHGFGYDALDCFEQMWMDQIRPDLAAFICSLKACGCVKTLEKGQEIHIQVIKLGFEEDTILGNALIDMYAKCCAIDEAQQILDMLQVHTVVSWNTLIVGYTDIGYHEDALDCYQVMLCKGLCPDDITFTAVLKACGGIAAVERGFLMHNEVTKKGIEANLIISNSLLDMYAKCGCFEEATQVFDKLQTQDEISWNTTISLFTQIEKGAHVFKSFERMVRDGKMPNLITFVNTLNACSHGGLLEEGQLCFVSMSEDYGLELTLQHYNCVIDLFGRAGQIDKALLMIKEMPCHPTIAIWLSLLVSCTKSMNSELGMHAYKHALQVGNNDPAIYVCMSNMFVRC